MKLTSLKRLQGFIEENNISGIIIALISFFAILLFSFTGAYNLFEYKLYDLRFTMKPTIAEWDALAFLNVDESSIINIGEYPWPRREYAKGLDVLREVGIRQMSFDFEFLDDTPKKINESIFNVLNSKIEKRGRIGRDELASIVLDDDEILSRGIENAKKVFLPYHFKKETLERHVDEEYRKELEEARRIFTEKASVKLPEEELYRYRGFVDPERVGTAIPIPKLIRAAQGFGFVDRDPDIDGIERRIRLVRVFQGRLYFQMGLVMLMDICGVKKEDVVVEPGERILLKGATNPITFEKGDIEIPIDENGMIYINWAGPGPLEESFHHISFYALIEYPMVKNEVYDYFDEQEIASGSKERSALYGELEETYREFSATDDLPLKRQKLQQISELRRKIRAIEEGYKKPLLEEIARIQAELKKGDDAKLKEALSNYTNYTTAIDIVIKVESLRDKMALIGLTATGTQDLGAIPTHHEYMMVGTWHNIINTILNEAFITRTSMTANYIIMFILAVMMGYIIQRLSAKRSMLLIVVSLVMINLINIGFFAIFNIWFDQLGTTLSVFLPSALIASVKFMKEESQKRYIKNAFSRYLAPGVIDQIIDNPDALELGGENRKISIFFSDVAKFSTISEKLTPPQLVALLNEYLSAMTDIILSYNGTIDKYEGDAIMAFYGAPYSFEDHALKCCFAAIDMKRRLREMQETWRKAGKDELYVRMGMNTGDAVVGNMGSQTRMDYTAMGDSVNLASRLEGANKFYSTYAMISESTYEATKDHIEARKLDTIRVVGKTEPIVIYELLGNKGTLPDRMLDMLDKYYNGFDHFQNRDWKKALSFFNQALKVIDDDGPSLTYRERCENFIKKPPTKKWDGVFSLKAK